MIKAKVYESALQFLLERKKDKMRHLFYNKIEIQPYLISKMIHRWQAQKVFKWRTHMFDFKLNFSKMYKDNDTKCKLGCSHIDSQDNVLKCDAIKALSAEKLDQSCYENIFGRNIVQINEAAKVLAKAMEIREAIVNPITTED